MRLHHVQLSMPAGAEERARAFYSAALGMDEVRKPASLAGRGGCWFRAHAHGSIAAEIHLGVEPGFVPGKKAHPALVVDSLAQLEALAARIQAGGFELSWAERESFDGYARFHCRDPFGNRVEVLCALAS